MKLTEAIHSFSAVISSHASFFLGRELFYVLSDQTPICKSKFLQEAASVIAGGSLVSLATGWFQPVELSGDRLRIFQNKEGQKRPSVYRKVDSKEKKTFTGKSSTENLPITSLNSPFSSSKKQLLQKTVFSDHSYIRSSRTVASLSISMLSFLCGYLYSWRESSDCLFGNFSNKEGLVVVSLSTFFNALRMH